MSKEYKFKAGDKVRLIRGWSDGSTTGFNTGRLQLYSVYEITDVIVDNYEAEIEYPYYINEVRYNVEECMLVLVEEAVTDTDEHGLPTPKETPPMTAVAQPKLEWTDNHYNFFYSLTEDDILDKKIKIDPYFVAKQWKIGSKDDSGALWHCFKTIARFGEKNSVEREIKALHAQIVRLAELHNVKL